MKRAIINSDFYQDSQVETLFFPDGAPHAKLPPNFDPASLLYLRARTWNDVGIGACVWDALTRNALTHALPFPALFMPYSPGARQDKTDGHAPITKSIVAVMFAPARNLHTFDIHSDLGNWNWKPKNWMPHDLGLPERPDIDLVIAPDKGAVGRAYAFKQAYCPNADVVEATKSRDQRSGRIYNYRLPEIPSSVRKALVVDDICDGGATFKLLGDAFKLGAHPEAKLELFVSHGVFSKGWFQLTSHYDHIYTTDSFCQYQPEQRLTIYSLKPLVERIANE